MVKKKRCKICDTPLSSYNIEKYCYAHHRAGQLLDDKRRDKIKFDEVRKRQKARYEKQKEERSGNNT